MFRRTDIAMIAAMIGVVTYTYSVKTSTKSVTKELAAVQRETEFELNSIDLLNADWEVLTAPQRIQSLVNVYQAELNLVPADAKRLIAISDIPMRPAAAMVETNIDEILAQFGDGDAGLITGSVNEGGQPLPAEGETTVNDILQGNGVQTAPVIGGDQ